MNLKEQSTFITPYYNTPIELFNEYTTNILKHGVKIIIVNDGSDEEHTKNLYDLMGDNDLVSIYELERNMKHTYALKKALENVDTKYVIRCDADDKYEKFPEVAEGDEDFDVLLLPKAQDNLIDFLTLGRSHVGSVFKTSVMDEVYLHEIEYITEKRRWLHEDQWHHLNLLDGDYDLRYCTNEGIYVRQFHGNSNTSRKSISRTKKRWETFMLWCMYFDKFDLHIECQKEIFGVEYAIAENWGITC